MTKRTIIIIAVIILLLCMALIPSFLVHGVLERMEKEIEPVRAQVESQNWEGSRVTFEGFETMLKENMQLFSASLVHEDIHRLVDSTDELKVGVSQRSRELSIKSYEHVMQYLNQLKDSLWLYPGNVF